MFLRNSGGKEETIDIKRCDEPNVAGAKNQSPCLFGGELRWELKEEVLRRSVGQNYNWLRNQRFREIEHVHYRSQNLRVIAKYVISSRLHALPGLGTCNIQVQS